MPRSAVPPGDIGGQNAVGCGIGKAARHVKVISRYRHTKHLAAKTDTAPGSTVPPGEAVGGNAVDVSERTADIKVIAHYCHVISITLWIVIGLPDRGPLCPVPKFNRGIRAGISAGIDSAILGCDSVNDAADSGKTRLAKLRIPMFVTRNGTRKSGRHQKNRDNN